LLEVIYSNDLQDSASPNEHPYYLSIWKFVSQGKRESQLPRLLRISTRALQAGLIFFGVSPLSSTSGGGRLSQGGKEKFVTRLAFRRATGQQRSEEAVTSLKAYRVEFVGPLTEYPGTENGRGKYQNVIGQAIEY